MEDKTAYYKLSSDIENSYRILIGLTIFSTFGILYGILGILLDGVWITIPFNYSELISITSFVLLIFIYVVFRHTQNLDKTIKGVHAESY